jgi:hydroxypyruvate isomerase
VRYSACLELLFAEAPVFSDRFQLAREAGFEAVEFWRWRDKDLGKVRQAISETGVTLHGFVAEPMLPLTDPAQRKSFLVGLGESIDAAHQLGTKNLIAQAGDEIGSLPRKQQHRAIVAGLAEAAPSLENAGVTLLLEPLNTLVDHPGYYLAYTPEALDIVEEVGSPNVRLLYDIYHSAVMGESPREVLDGRVSLLGHVHLADAPGRGEPGSGRIPWREHLDWLDEHGYKGYVGLEYRPRGDTLSSLALLTR